MSNVFNCPQVAYLPFFILLQNLLHFFGTAVTQVLSSTETSCNFFYKERAEKKTHNSEGNYRSNSQCQEWEEDLKCYSGTNLGIRSPGMYSSSAPYLCG